MNSRKTTMFVSSALGLAVLVAILALGGRKPRHQYLTATIERGSIVRAVTATGTLNPVVTVQVGSHVSGPIVAIYVDFNSPVKAGQLIAKIDPRPFEVEVAQARAVVDNYRAELLKNQADLRYKKLLYQRTSRLLTKGAVSADAVDNNLSAAQQAQAEVELTRASLRQQQAALKAAQINLDYANIVSPVSGTVVARNVDVGQTVAASFQTPTLFLIAKDLTQMQVDASVSESDIGDVRLGQIALFTVDAFPQRQFKGTVTQVRQAPITVQNVVTYDVVVGITNPELLLKPGMTANLTVVTARRDAVLKVPLRALRFVPHRAGRAQAVVRDTAGIPREATVWVRRERQVEPVAFVTGLDDGSFVEVRGDKLHEGDRVVLSESRISTAMTSGSILRLFR
jgi:HlyD family secretion protein